MYHTNVHKNSSRFPIQQFLLNTLVDDGFLYALLLLAVNIGLSQSWIAWLRQPTLRYLPT